MWRQPDPQARQHMRRWLAVATAAVALAAGTTQLVVDWRSMLGPDDSAPAPPIGAGVSLEAGRAATHGSVRTLTGDVIQDNSGSIVLYNNAFRVEVVRATDAASAAKQQLRDDILAVLDGLVDEVGSRSLSDEQARALGQKLGTILDAAPVSPYQLHGREFTLRPGTAYFLPGGADSVAFVGAAKDGTPDAIIIRRNGRESTMPVGAVREFRQGAESCRLLLHEVAGDFSAATFSYTCRS